MQLDNQALHGGAPRLDSVVSPDSNSNGRQCTSAGGVHGWMESWRHTGGGAAAAASGLGGERPRRAVDEVSSASSRTGAQGAAASVPHEATSGGDTDVIHRSGGQTTWGVICKIWD